MTYLLTKEELDALQNSYKGSVRAASLADVNLAATHTALDGVTLADGDRALLKDQTAPAENGVYDWASGTQMYTRSDDFLTGKVESALLLSIKEGTQATQLWQLATADPITIGTTGLSFMMAGGGGGASDLAMVLATGNSTGGLDIEITAGDGLVTTDPGGGVRSLMQMSFNGSEPAGATIGDGDLMIFDDGVNPPTTFEFDSNASVVETDFLRQIAFTAGQNMNPTLNNIIGAAIDNAPRLDMFYTQAFGTGARFDNLRFGTIGNVAYTITPIGGGGTGIDNGANWSFSGGGSFINGVNYNAGGDIPTTPQGDGAVQSNGLHQFLGAGEFDAIALRPLGEASKVKVFASDGGDGLVADSLYAVDPSDNVNKIMLADQHQVMVAPKASVDGNGGTLTVTTFYFDPSNYEPGRSFFFGGVLSVDITTSLGSLILFNLSDSQIVTTAGLTVTGGGAGTPAKVEAALTLGDAANNLKTTERLYEVRIENDGTTEVTNLGSAFMRVK